MKTRPGGITTACPFCGEELDDDMRDFLNASGIPHCPKANDFWSELALNQGDVQEERLKQAGEKDKGIHTPSLVDGAHTGRLDS